MGLDNSKLMKDKSKIGVIHLVWLPLGLECFKEFIDSFIANPPGMEYELILLFNGVNDEKDIDQYCKYALQHSISFKKYCLKEGQDIDCYFWIANQIDNEYVFYLNSYSIILRNNWLKLYWDNVNEKTGVISATGSWQSFVSSVFTGNSWKWDSQKSVRENYKKYKLLIKAHTLWRFYFPLFPNYHVRTTAFIIRRTVFISLKKPVLKRKFDAYRFESGINGLTRQLIKKGYETLVIDREGYVFKPEQWHISKTFWIGNQENLLISDNQTRMYHGASAQQKGRLTFNAWGLYEQV